MTQNKGLGRKLAIGLFMMLVLLVAVTAFGALNTDATRGRTALLFGDIASLQDAVMPEHMLN